MIPYFIIPYILSHPKSRQRVRVRVSFLVILRVVCMLWYDVLYHTTYLPTLTLFVVPSK